MNAVVTADERQELREAVKSVRAEWRERLSLASKLSPTSKLAKKAGVLLLDLDIFDDRVAEAGGEEELVFVICAQVASGCTLTQWCEHYVVQRGLVWAFLTETPERYERYCRALEGIADAYVAETIEIADDASRDTIEGPRGGEVLDTEWMARSKLRVDTRFKLAAKYDKKRFGDDKSTNVAVMTDIKITHESA